MAFRASLERMVDMKLRLWTMGLAGFLALGVATAATTYYVDDNSNDGDVYTPTATGNEANDGISPTTPKRTLNNLLATTNLLPGDIVLIDAGTYTDNVVIPNTMNGAPDNRIVFQGVPITNAAAGGTVFAPAGGNAFDVSGNYLHFRDIKTTGGASGFYLRSSSFGEYERVQSTGTSGNPLVLSGASNTNAFRRCVFATTAVALGMNCQVGKGNYIENCVGYAPSSAALGSRSGNISNVVNSILYGQWAMAYPEGISDAGSHNILFGTLATHLDYETLAEVQRINTNWHDNAVADPKFVNAAGLDFHLLSAAGFVSNGVWVTNPAVGFSPGIDFGARE